MPRVGRLSVDLTAKTSEFDKRIQKSRGLLSRNTRRMSGDAMAFSNNVSNSFRRAAQASALLTGPLGGIASRFSVLASSVSMFGLAAAGIMGAMTGLTYSFVKSVQAADELEGGLNKIEALLKATGQASGVTSDEVINFSQSLARNTLASVAGVEAAAAKLMTFRNVGRSVFFDVLTVAQDMTATGFGPLNSTITQLGKAFEDPIRGLDALRRSGTQFTGQVKDQITTLVEQGNLLEAQKLILSELQKQYGGAGAGEGGGLSKAVDSLTQSWKNMLESMSKTAGVYNVAVTAMQVLDHTIRNIRDSIDDFNLEEIIDEGGQHALDVVNRNLDNVNAKLKEYRELQKQGGPVTFNTQGQVVNLGPEIKQLEERRKLLSDARTTIEDDMEAEKELARIRGEATQKLNAQNAAEDALAKQREKRRKRVENLVASVENQAKAIEEYNRVLSETGDIDEAKEARQRFIAVQKLGKEATQEEIEAMEDAINRRIIAKNLENDLTKEIKQSIDTQKKLAEELGRTGGEAFGSLVTGTDKWRDSLERLIITLVKMASTAAFKRMMGMGGTGGDIFDVFGSALGSGFSSLFGGGGGGGFVPYSQAPAWGTGASSVSVSPLPPVTGYASGGRPPLGRASLVGENGPEMFVPDTKGTIIPNNAMKNMGNTIINADLRGASVEAVQRLERFVSNIDATLEQRSVMAVKNTRVRNPNYLQLGSK